MYLRVCEMILQASRDRKPYEEVEGLGLRNHAAQEDREVGEGAVLWC